MEEHVGPVVRSVVSSFRQHVVREVVRGVGAIHDRAIRKAMTNCTSFVDVKLGNKDIGHQTGRGGGAAWQGKRKLTHARNLPIYS